MVHVISFCWSTLDSLALFIQIHPHNTDYTFTESYKYRSSGEELNEGASLLEEGNDGNQKRSNGISCCKAFWVSHIANISWNLTSFE